MLNPPRPINPFSLPPKDDAIIIEMLEAVGFRVRKDNNEQQYRRMLQLLGGLERLDLLREPTLLNLFLNAQIRKGSAYPLENLRQIANPKHRVQTFYDYIHYCIEQKIFLRGYSLPCPHCDLTHWYRLHDLHDVMECWGCGNAFYAPLEIDFAYKPSEFITRALKNGGLTVLLSLRILYQTARNTFQWGAGYQLQKDGKHTDLDLVALVDETLVIVECKDHIPRIERTARQLQHILQTAQQLIDKGLFVFAVLDMTIPEQIKAVMHQAAVPAHILNRRALLEHPTLSTET